VAVCYVAFMASGSPQLLKHKLFAALDFSFYILLSLFQSNEAAHVPVKVSRHRLVQRLD